MLRFWPRFCGNQNVYTSASQRWLDGLMAQMANRAGLRRRNSMTMPHSSERCPYHQHEIALSGAPCAKFAFDQTLLGTLTGPEIQRA